VRRGIAQLIDDRPGAIVPEAVSAADVMPGRVSGRECRQARMRDLSTDFAAPLPRW